MPVKIIDYNDIDINKLAKTANKFSIGEKTLIDLPNESQGLMPDEKWKKKKQK